jgi:hypothetical protein
MNIEYEGLVGHCWRALTITTEYPQVHTITGIQTDSNQPFHIEHSPDGELWSPVEGELTGEDANVVQPLEPFACRFTRMTWATTGGTNGIHAQFVGVEDDEQKLDDGSRGEQKLDDGSDACDTEDASCAPCTPNLPCIGSAFEDACEALQAKIGAHIASVEDEIANEEKRYAEEYDENCVDWLERLEEGVKDFESYYEQHMAELRCVLRAKRNAHEARLADIEKEFLVDRQSALDEAKVRMQNKLDAFGVDVEE